jgi:hypothetical protein
VCSLAASGGEAAHEDKGGSGYQSEHRKSNLT